MTELRNKHGKTFKVSVTEEDGTGLEHFVVVYPGRWMRNTGGPEDQLHSMIRHALDEADIACFDNVEDADQFYTELEAELTEEEEQTDGTASLGAPGPKP